jgi:hypothetical protein
MRLVIDNLELFSREVQMSLNQADWQTKREIIRTLVKRVELDSEQINIVYRVDIRPFDRSPDGGTKHYCGKRCRVFEAPAHIIQRMAIRWLSRGCSRNDRLPWNHWIRRRLLDLAQLKGVDDLLVGQGVGDDDHPLAQFHPVAAF